MILLLQVTVVSGDTTTANSINMVVQDRLLMLANSATGTPAGDVGLLFNRGNQGNAAFFYDESATTLKYQTLKIHQQIHPYLLLRQVILM